MPLLPNQPFTEGDEWTPELAYLACSAPVYDDQPQYLGHRERIRDDELSNDSTAIKTRFAAVADSLKVTVSSGRTLAYTSGTVTDLDSRAVSVASGLVVAPDNATSWVYVDGSGVVACSVNPPVIRTLLAKVTTVAGSVTLLEDQRSLAIRRVLPLTRSLQVFGGINTSDYTATQGETLDQGLYYFRNFTVPAGISINVSRSAKILCSGDVSIQGNITVTQMGYGAPNTAYFISQNANAGGVPSSGLGSRGQGYPWGSQSFGTGGSQGIIAAPNSNSAGYPGDSGDGGGCLWLEASGAINVSGQIVAKGSNATLGGSDVTTLAPGATISTYYVVIGGAGAGSGGLVYLASLQSVTVTSSGVLDVTGGNGANGFTYTSSGTHVALGGDGGTGGYVVIVSPSINTSGSTINLSGGVAGSPAGGGTLTGNTYTATNPVAQCAGGLGGGFGGTTGGWRFTSGTTTKTWTKGTPQAGKLVLRQYTPVS